MVISLYVGYTPVLVGDSTDTLERGAQHSLSTKCDHRNPVCQPSKLWSTKDTNLGLACLVINSWDTWAMLNIRFICTSRNT